MKKTIIILTVILLAALSCKKEKDFVVDGTPTLTVSVGEATVFTLDGGQYQLDIESYAYSLSANKNENVLKASQFEVRSNLQWKIVPATGEEYEWVHPFPDHGEKEGRFIFKNTRNFRQDATRDAYFNVMVNDGGGWRPLEGMITVHQAQSADFLTKSAAKFEISLAGGKSNLAILANIPWTYSVEPMEDYATESLDWLTDNTGEHPIDQYIDTLRFVSAPNDGSIRGAKIHIFYSLAGEECDEVVPLTQYGEAIALEGFPVEWTVGDVAETGSVGTFAADGVMQATTGSGTIAWAQAPENIELGYPALRTVGSTGEPYVTGCWVGDYWEFRSAAPISAGTIAKIELSTRPSAKGMRYWTLMYLDGDEWLPIGELSTAEIAGEEIRYNVSMTAGGSVNTQISSVFKVRNNTEAAAVRLVCSGREGVDGTVYDIPGGYTIRLSNRSGDDLDVMPKISIVAAGSEVLVPANIEVTGLTDGILSFEGTPSAPAVINIKSDQDFSLSSSVDWLTVDPASGIASNSGVSVTVTCAPSDLSTMRKGYLTVKSGITLKQIPVIQGAAGGELDPFIAVTSGSSVSVPAGPGQTTVWVLSNVDVTAAAVGSWLSVEAVPSTRGMAETKEFIVSYDGNSDPETRSGSVRFYNTAKNLEAVVSFSQKGAVAFPVVWSMPAPNNVKGVDYDLFNTTGSYVFSDTHDGKLTVVRTSTTLANNKNTTYQARTEPRWNGKHCLLHYGIYKEDYWLFEVFGVMKPAGTYSIEYCVESSNNGPKYFALEYSTDGENWTVIDGQEGSYSVVVDEVEQTENFIYTYAIDTASTVKTISKSFHLDAITSPSTVSVRARCVSVSRVAGTPMGVNHEATNRVGDHVTINFTAD